MLIEFVKMLGGMKGIILAGGKRFIGTLRTLNGLRILCPVIMQVITKECTQEINFSSYVSIREMKEIYEK